MTLAYIGSLSELANTHITGPASQLSSNWDRIAIGHCQALVMRCLYWGWKISIMVTFEKTFNHPLENREIEQEKDNMPVGEQEPAEQEVKLKVFNWS